jgi:hypothetical protein
MSSPYFHHRQTPVWRPRINGEHTMKITELLLQAELDRKAVGIRKKLEIGITMRYVKIAEHYKVEAVVKLERYRAVQMQEALVKMQHEQQEREKQGMLQ